MTMEYARELPENDLSVAESRANYRSEGDEVLFDIRETIGILRKSNTGWTRELNVVCWNGGAPRFDIREWDPLHEKMGRGITFTNAEADQICKWFAVRGTDLASLPKGAPEDFENMEATADNVPF